MLIKYLGHSAFYIETSSTSIVIDPMYDKSTISIKPEYVIITHAHADHIGHALELHERGAKIISIYEIVNFLSKKVDPNSRVHGKNMTGISYSGFVDLDDFKVKLVYALHSSSYEDENVGIASGVIIQADGKCIYHAGDTGLFGDMKLIGDRHKIDIAMLPIGGFYTMDIDDAVYSLSMLRPKNVIPMHYNTFPAISVDIEEFKEKVEATKISHPVIMKVEQEIKIQ